ncbi:MAG: hypoxanthine phosphoribosyltransferase [Chloroflexi bacterium]|nr:hypoxanthine phosphoribosyltransferase [Chloroflexota bacterium]
MTSKAPVSVARYYGALQEIARAANSGASIKEALDAIVRIAAKALRGSACSLLFLDPEKRRLTHSSHYGLSDWYVRKGLLDASRSLAESLEGKTVAIYDVAKDPRVQYPEVAEKERIASILSVPLVAKGEVMGTARVYTRERRRFSKKEEAFLSAVADLSVLALEKRDTGKIPEEGTRGEAEKGCVPMGRAVVFAHPSEEEFARLLDFYQIEWVYEPRSFPLRWEGERIKEMFTPDFYLPALDLYIELTTLKQSLVTQKNRKLRRIKDLYPDINIKLLYQKDYLRLLAKYGYGPLAGATVRGVEKVFLSGGQIQARVRQLGRQISKDYAGRPLVLIGVLRGVVCFMADLMRHLTQIAGVDFLSISYYTEDTSGAVRITKDLDISIAGQDVLMVEDIVDTGMTLNYILKYLDARKPASLKVCALLDKRVRRLVDVPLDYIGFEIPDEFVVGYGLDYREQYRNLPFIGILKPEIADISQEATNKAEVGPEAVRARHKSAAASGG